MCLLLFSDTHPPQFKSCPSTLSNYTRPDESTGLVMWKVPEATDNSGIDPVITCNSQKNLFTIGRTEIVCEAVDESSNRAKCYFVVNIIGKHFSFFKILSLFYWYIFSLKISGFVMKKNLKNKTIVMGERNAPQRLIV